MSDNFPHKWSVFFKIQNFFNIYCWKDFCIFLKSITTNILSIFAVASGCDSDDDNIDDDDENDIKDNGDDDEVVVGGARR